MRRAKPGRLDGTVSSVTSGTNTVQYTYGADHQRALQIQASETDHFYGFGPTDHSELQTFSNGASTWVDYLYAPTGLIGAVYTTTPAGGGTPQSTKLLFASDHLGSIASTYKGLVSFVPRSYDNWGKQRFTTGADDTANTLWGQNAEPRGYIGQEQVAATGLINLNARMYDPQLGRFLSVDPIVESVYNLQALNPYSYAQNSPLTFSDPSGLCKGLFGCTIGQVGNVFNGAAKFVNRTLGPAARVVAIAAAVVGQYYLLPELEGYATFGAVLDASPALAGADVAIAGAIGGAINTGTLRGAVIGAATAEAFWGVGEFAKPALNIPTQAGITLNPDQAVASAALHAAVGCVSSAAGGGQCASGALQGGLGDLIATQGGPLLPQNIYLQSAVAGLGGGTGAALTGGRFGDGFYLAAAAYLFNQCGEGSEECDPEKILEKQEHPISPLGGTSGVSASNFAPLDIGPLAGPGASSPEAIIAPQGNLIGTPNPGSPSGKIRNLPGGDQAAQSLFNSLAQFGSLSSNPTYPGVGFSLPNGGFVGYRDGSAAKSEVPAVDVKIPGFFTGKFHFP